MECMRNARVWVILVQCKLHTLTLMQIQTKRLKMLTEISIIDFLLITFTCEVRAFYKLI